MSIPTPINIPPSLLPSDGRFGSGPSKIRDEQIMALDRARYSLLGTSHRREPVRGLVHHLRTGLAQLLQLPDGYEIVLGVGGSSLVWDAAAYSLIRHRSQHLVLGEFSAKFAAAAHAPFLTAPEVLRAEPGTLISPQYSAEADAYAWPHNETSTGVATPVRRVAGATSDQLIIVDATSAAGGLPVDIGETDFYYFAPQKVFGSDGGMWFAACSPAAIARIDEIAATDRWIPDVLSLSLAVANSRQDQTLNTPALATMIMMAEQLNWFLDNGGMAWTVGRSAASAQHVYEWAQAREYTTPFVADPAVRSAVIATIDLDPAIDAQAVLAALRANGIVDIDPYRKLGRNQLRIGMFPAVEPSDVEALTACIDYVIERLP